MVSVKGLGGLPEPKPDRTGKLRNERESPAPGASGRAEDASRDGLAISSEARTASDVARIVQASKADGDIRADRVAAAREAIARGDYKNPDVIAKVAERISKLLG